MHFLYVFSPDSVFMFPCLLLFVVEISELSGSLWCFIFPIVTHSQEIKQPGESQETCCSILLTNTSKSTTAVFSPNSWQSNHSVTVDLYWRIQAVHIYSTSKSCNKFWHSLSFIKQSRAHGGSKTHLYSSVLPFMLTLSPLGVAGLKPLSHKSY